MNQTVGTLGRDGIYALFADKISREVMRICGLRSEAASDRTQTAWTELIQYARDNKTMNVETFIPRAMMRIRGAIIDDIRRDDPRVRSQRVNAAKVSAAAHAVTARTGNRPTTLELAEQMGLAIGEMYSMLDCLHRDVVIFSSEAIEEEGLTEFTESALDTFLAQEQLERLVEALSLLPKRDLEVIKLRYFEGLKNREIAARLNVSDSRATELHKRGIEKLRQELLTD
ncbi:MULTISPECIES: sigma-70 family RNA polymerase sigma factor [unclassified Paraburkholderia]|uniref:sigma-70 family RNA polymerase sigma factor n=1 Tax=unclassified Paraburkholderia TaxID=2615204 RepID=UPI002AB0AE6E|nr:MULTISPECIES: sigma-70 family RNA polymerase sigma factor [unclassified Paraburkholderia]